ncbi:MULTISPECIES: hypothetical protein [unclassified Fibrobacter]|uniref:hypothetical protein n=1 Tax=unclassified Fibrobacter TaxID=2634177 RepID=UPI000D6D2B06|nr:MULTISPECIES: hypothetical protein [unclassified Fibrobacter]PWJ59746.1 hypothetical protein BGX12_14020 [Fibrobacter sp. UWR4]PZW63584.1 hypothetical protein C8E88_104320 [Fibrobacter sp. UWR1]
MNFKKLVLGTFSLAALTLFAACSDSGSSSKSDEEADSSSSVASFKSSTSLSDRADVDYKDTASIGDTMRIYVELFQGDSSKMDSSVLYVDSLDRNFPMYLGEFPKGSRIRVYASTYNMEKDTIRVRNELGDYLRAITAVPKGNGRKDSAYVNYFIPSAGTGEEGVFKDSNLFVAFKDQHYYLEVTGQFTDSTSLRMMVLVDTAYYEYTGEKETFKMKMNDSLRGIILIDDAPEKVAVQFSATEGYSVNVTTQGTNIKNYELTDGKDVLGTTNSNLDTLLIPNDSITWNLNIKTENFSSIWTGPYAFFETKTSARELEKGEYFSNPDSIHYPGETFERTRPKNLAAKYDIYQEQFVWIGDYKKGDSILVKHWIKNYEENNVTSPVTLEVLDKNKKSQGNINSVYGGSFVVSGDMPEGPFYLHYTRSNSKPLAQVEDSLRYVLQLYTLIQQPGLLASMDFYNAENDSISNNIRATVGDTLHLNQFQFYMTNKDGSSWDDAGLEITWFVPCESLNYINNKYSVSNCEANENGEQELSSNYVIVQSDAAGNTAKLIAQSVADPTKRVDLNVKIIAK